LKTSEETVMNAGEQVIVFNYSI